MVGHGDMRCWPRSGLWGAFLLGLAGGFGHCLTMCGPLVAAASLADGCGAQTGGGGAGAWGRRVPGLLPRRTPAHLRLAGGATGPAWGRGAITALGGPFSPTALPQWLKVAVGVTMLVTGVVLLWSALAGRVVRIPEPTRLITDRVWFRRATDSVLARGPRWGFALGALMGLLPCAPLLPVELAALATGWPLYGALTMLAFGLGTVPALAGFGAASGLVGARARGAFAVAAGALLVLCPGRESSHGAWTRARPSGDPDGERPHAARRAAGLRPVRTAADRPAAPRCRPLILLRGLPPRLDDRRAERAHLAPLQSGRPRTRTRGRLAAKPRLRQRSERGGRPCASTACGARRARWSSKTLCSASTAYSTPR